MSGRMHEGERALMMIGPHTGISLDFLLERRRSALSTARQGLMKDKTNDPRLVLLDMAIVNGEEEEQRDLGES